MQVQEGSLTAFQVQDQYIIKSIEWYFLSPSSMYHIVDQNPVR